jgi:hypothetical protein
MPTFISSHIIHNNPYFHVAIAVQFNNRNRILPSSHGGTLLYSISSTALISLLPVTPYIFHLFVRNKSTTLRHRMHIVPCRFSVSSLRNTRRHCNRKFRPSYLQIISCLFHIYCTPETNPVSANGPVQNLFKFSLGASLSKV